MGNPHTPHRPDYAIGRPLRRRGRAARLLLIATVLFTLAGVRLVQRGVATRVRLLYWQHRCAEYDGPVVQPTPFNPVPWPRCFQSLWTVLADSRCNVGPSFFDGRSYPVVFLHERISHAGTRRLIAMDFRPNVSHGQLCSLDCLVLDPATFGSPATGTAKVAAWVPGFPENVQFDQLRAATADLADASHFVFSYTEWVAAQPADFFAAFEFHAATRPVNERRLIRHMADGWLLDDGTRERPVPRGGPAGRHSRSIYPDHAREDRARWTARPTRGLATLRNRLGL